MWLAGVVVDVVFYFFFLVRGGARMPRRWCPYHYRIEPVADVQRHPPGTPPLRMVLRGRASERKPASAERVQDSRPQHLRSTLHREYGQLFSEVLSSLGPLFRRHDDARCLALARIEAVRMHPIHL